ncbi:MAG: hypothetical protein MK175_12465 [Pseudoalteromonas sp.]|uniref:GapS4a family protein n=1 Tax=Pseudoalteromonas sp. TaxID=53249 RepID=UPI0025F58B5F|nr:hypothetical protein [Pseudoalteromonas sp.]MCH2087995.1 hypothetical protein [Pseudoalteromonas sp.]
MAGERSKSIGEVGESIAENFFNKIGWGLPQKGVYFQCYKNQEHALKTSKNDEKNVHGIDFQISYKSALESETLNNLLISVKHLKDSNYPKSATVKFQDYISDLVHSMDCFKRSPLRREVASGVTGCKAINEIPILFYVSSRNDENYDFVTCLQNSRFINDYDIKELYIVDNKKITFILDVLNYIEKTYSDYNWYFYHPMTGMNVADSNILHHSKRMQVEFLTSPFIPFVLKKKIGVHETCKFFLASVDGFTSDNFAKYLMYCRANTNDNISDIEISFADYFSDDSYGDVKKVLNAFDSELKVSVTNYKPNFRSLAHD